MIEPVADRKHKEYKDKLNYEAGLLGQINRMANYRDINLRQYASSIETFMLMCPPDITQQSYDKLKELNLKPGEYDSMNIEKLTKYDLLWRYINTLLIKEGLIYKKSSYEIGMEE